MTIKNLNEQEAKNRAASESGEVQDQSDDKTNVSDTSLVDDESNVQELNEK